MTDRHASSGANNVSYCARPPSSSVRAPVRRAKQRRETQPLRPRVRGVRSMQPDRNSGHIRRRLRDCGHRPLLPRRPCGARTTATRDRRERLHAFHHRLELVALRLRLDDQDARRLLIHFLSISYSLCTPPRVALLLSRQRAAATNQQAIGVPGRSPPLARSRHMSSARTSAGSSMKVIIPRATPFITFRTQVRQSVKTVIGINRRANAPRYRRHGLPAEQLRQPGHDHPCPSWS